MNRRVANRFNVHRMNSIVSKNVEKRMKRSRGKCNRVVRSSRGKAILDEINRTLSGNNRLDVTKGREGGGRGGKGREGRSEGGDLFGMS